MRFNPEQCARILAASEAVKEARDTGKITDETIAAFRAATQLGVYPPKKERPLSVKNVDAEQGSWPHYEAALASAAQRGIDLKALAENAKSATDEAKRQALQRASSFFDEILSDIDGALLGALQAVERVREREEARARKPDAATSTRLTVEQIRKILKEKTKAFTTGEMKPEQAQMAAARSTLHEVYEATTLLGNDYTDDEIEVFRSVIISAVVEILVQGDKDVTEAEHEARAWLDRAIAYERRALAAQRPATATSGDHGARQSANPKPTPKRERRKGQKSHDKVGTLGQLLIEAGVAKPPKAANGD